MESITLDRDVMHERDRLSPRFAELIYNGFWYSPEMEFLRASIDASQVGVTGEVRAVLYKGGITITGRRSPVSLYDQALVSFDDAGPGGHTYDASDAGRGGRAYDASDAGGFIRLQGLRLRKP